MPNGKIVLNIASIINKNRNELIEDWVEHIISYIGTKALKVTNETQLKLQTSQLLDNLAIAIQSGQINVKSAEYSSTIELLKKISIANAEKGFSPTETAIYVLSFKDAFLHYLQKEIGNDFERLKSEVITINKIVDHLALLTFETYTSKREEVIYQQSQALMELSTPIIELWEKILLLPIIGVVDTNRATQIVENLLTSIVKLKSQIVILDITGVPVMDTAVAANLIKMTSAVKMLGAEVIMTGISPETAQTLVKLNINLSHITTLGRLQTGIQEAFSKLGKKIVNRQGGT